MGQNNSTTLHNRAAPSSQTDHKPRVPPPRPTSPPQIPKIPNYAVPENRVLPIGAMEMPNKRQLLRPVSQELTKFHPDFADIFQYEDNVGESLAQENGELGDGGSGGVGDGGEGKENMMMKGSVVSGSLANGGFHRSSQPLANGDISGKPNNIELSRSQSLQEKRSNEHVLVNGFVSSNPNGSDVMDRGRRGAGIQRTNSLDRSSAGPSKIRAHKRYPSASTSLANEASVIPEDPREHLYTHWRQDPFSNPTPSVTSLPLKNSFDLDYKMNLTYAQLAEHRRQKRVADLEDKTGQKLADLGADLQDKSSLPVSPFDRNNYTPSQPSASSTTGSSDTGVSKSKKRRAPPPPSSSSTQNRDSSPGRLSLDVEPPADYDLDDPSPPLDTTSPWNSSLSRNNSNASAISKTSKGPAPNLPLAPPPAPPAPLTSPLPATPKSTANATSPSSGVLPSKTTSPISAASARLIAQAKAELEALKKLEVILKEKDGKVKAENEDKVKVESTEEGSAGSGSGEKAHTEEDKKEDADDDGKEGTVDDVKNKEKDGEEDSEGKASTMSLSSNDVDTTTTTTTNINNNNNKPNTDQDHSKKADPDNGPRRLSSLLQHDIVLAAQARSAKGQVKAKVPVQHAKPKDPAQLFREELAKAATAREERVKSGESGKEKIESTATPADHAENGNGFLVFKSDMVQVKRVTSDHDASPSGKEVAQNKPAPPPVFPKPESPTDTTPKEAKVSITKSESDLLNASHEDRKPPQTTLSRQRPPEGYDDDSLAMRKAVSHNGILDLSDDDDVHVHTSVSNRQSSSSHHLSQDWKPEDDLDTDDDLMDDMTYSRSSTALEASDGFKSSMIPSKVDDLKTAKRKSSKSGRRESESSTDEKNKFGSIRKFQKSVHKGVRNAFGSISKASGKLLRRNKSHDFGLEDTEGGKYRVTRDDDSCPKPVLTNGLDQHFAMNGHLSERYSDDEEDSEDDGPQDPTVLNGNDKKFRKMKRAGVAYVSSKGQIVVLPEYSDVTLDQEGNVVEEKEDNGRAPKIFRKQKKYSYESTVRRQEKYRAAEQFAEEIREKERQIEVERRKQKDMEREFQRLRDMETQERLQRLQTAQLQQQMNLLQQQQQQLSSMHFTPGSSVPQHPHQRYSVPDFPSQHTGLYTSATGLGGVGTPMPPINMSSYTVQSTTPFGTPASTAASTVGGYDVNYLSNYMRMMGIQPPTTQQQWAYLLTSVQGVHPHAVFDPTTKNQSMLVNSAGPDLSQFFSSKTSPYTDTSALVAQKASLMNILNSGQLPQAVAADAGVGTGGVLPATRPTSTATVTQHPPLSSSRSSRPKSAADLSTADQNEALKERANPVYSSSDDEGDVDRRAHKSKSASRSRVARSGSGKDRQRPHSTALSLGQYNVYRDVTSREEAGVTRVHVPDYRHDDSSVVDDVPEAAEDCEDESSEDEEMRDMNGRKIRDVEVTPAPVDEEEEDCEDGFKTVQFQRSSSVTRPTSALPPKVYGPLGYKPVAFVSDNARSKVLTDGTSKR